MKNLIISSNNDTETQPLSPKDTQILLNNQIKYLHDLIQKTLISIQKYKQLDIIGANELNQGIHNLEQLYRELSNNKLLLKSKGNISKINTNLEVIRNDLHSIFKMYGTENIHDLLNVVFGDNYLSTINWNKDKYSLIEKYFHPINFKTMNWKTERNNNSNEIVEKNKIVDDFMIVEKSNNLECFDLCRTNDTFQTKVYGVKIAIHSQTHKKTLIIAGLVDDLLTTCIDNDHLNHNLESLIKESSSYSEYDINMFHKFIQSLTLKELIVYSTTELIKKFQGYLSQILLIKQKTIAQVVQEFINNDLYGQRTTLIQLLLKSDEHEFQYLAYLLYDLLSNDNNGNIDTSEQTLLFDSLPWRIKSFFAG